MTPSSELDYLFEDLESPRMASYSSTCPFTAPKIDMAFPFEKLCGELRNNIYAEYFASIPEAQIIQINERGSLILPPLSLVSRKLRFETEGYLYSALSNPVTAIHAQIRDYNPKPLITTLQRLSGMLELSRADLVKRTKVFFVGNLNYANLYQWICDNIADPEQTPVFAHEQGTISGFEDVSVFTGRLSLRAFVKQFEAIKAQSPSCAPWTSAARDFHNQIEEFCMEVIPRLRSRNKEDLNTYVFKTVAHYHHEIMKSRPKHGSRIARKRQRYYGCCNDFDMAQLMYNFHLDCNQALLGLRLGPQGLGLFRDVMDYSA
jgi:hypothetical protein